MFGVSFLIFFVFAKATYTILKVILFKISNSHLVVYFFAFNHQVRFPCAIFSLILLRHLKFIFKVNSLTILHF